MLSRKDFTDALEEVKSVIRFHDDLVELFSKYKLWGDMDFKDCVDTVLHLLEITCGDKDSLINDFVFELNFGANEKNRIIKDSNGKRIDFRTADELYDRLLSDYTKRHTQEETGV